MTAPQYSCQGGLKLMAIMNFKISILALIFAYTIWVMRPIKRTVGGFNWVSWASIS